MNSDAPVAARGSAVAGAVFVDIDGTLVPPPGSAVHIARYLGSEEETARLEAAYAAGEIGTDEVAAGGARAWAGHTEAEIDIWLDGVPLVGGIEETVGWCRGRGLAVVPAGLAVAFNAGPRARAAAYTAVDGGDLSAVLPVLRNWLDRT